MLRSICSRNGISMIEVLIAMFLTAIATVSILAMMPIASQTASKSDYLGRAVGILQSELELRESQVLRNSSILPIFGTQTRSVQVSDPFVASTGINGDVTINVRTSIVKGAGTSWLVTVNVSWLGNSRGITNSIIATPQSYF